MVSTRPSLSTSCENKRLGLSDTVFAQIRRYSEAVKRNHRPPMDEAVALAKLIGRRPDAEAVFREAGRMLARQAYQTISPLTRRMLLMLPSLLARPIALRHTRRITGRYAAGAVRRVGSAILLEVRESVTLDAAPRLGGCAYYESALREFAAAARGRRRCGGTCAVREPRRRHL